VNPGVGAPAALGQDALAGNTFDGVGKVALDGLMAGLNLPAVEIGAVVGQGKFPVHYKSFGILSDLEELLGLLAGLGHLIAYSWFRLVCEFRFRGTKAAIFTYT
jgi:hypothetical protein